jgi:hypothetical protein
MTRCTLEGRETGVRDTFLLPGDLLAAVLEDPTDERGTVEVIESRLQFERLRERRDAATVHPHRHNGVAKVINLPLGGGATISVS